MIVMKNHLLGFTQKKKPPSVWAVSLWFFPTFLLILLLYNLVTVHMFEHVHEPDNHVHKDGNQRGKHEINQLHLN
jgi:hypothetical protein